MLKQTFSKTDSYHIEWHEVGDQFHIHCVVSVWSKSVLKELYGEFVKLRQFISGLGYECFYSISPNPKFCELFCGESIGEQNGKEVMMWVI